MITGCSATGECRGELVAEVIKRLVLALLSLLGSLYCHSGGSGDRLGGPSGRAVGLGGGELLGVEVVGEVTTTLGDFDITDAGK